MMILRRIASAILWLMMTVVVIVWFPIVTLIFLATAPFDPGRYAAGRFFRFTAVAATAVNPFWRFRITGYRITDPRRPYVVVANHESYADVLLLSHLPWEMKWLSKDTIFRIPLLGWMMHMAGDIEVRRDDPESRGQALDEIRDRLAKRVSVMIMPEGTRSRSGELLPFKDGAFRVAIEAGAPVVPVAVWGTRGAMAKGSLLFGRARAVCRVLPPVETAGLTIRDVHDLKQRVRAMIAAAREELRLEMA